MKKKKCTNCERLETENFDLEIRLAKLNSVADLNQQKLIAYRNLREMAKVLISSLPQVNYAVIDEIKKAIDEFEEWENQTDRLNYASEQRSLNFIEIQGYHEESQLWTSFSNNFESQHISASTRSTAQIPATQSRISSTETQTHIFDNPTSEIENPNCSLETSSSR